MPLTVTARIQADATKADELAAHMKTLVEAVRQEPGCLQYELHRGTKHPDLFMFVELWETRALWEAHMQGAALKTFNAAIPSGSIQSAEILQLERIA